MKHSLLALLLPVATFTRTIDVAIDEHFMRSASKAEIEALYRFLGSQWEMAMHLKHYVEAQPAP